MCTARARESEREQARGCASAKQVWLSSLLSHNILSHSRSLIPSLPLWQTYFKIKPVELVKLFVYIFSWLFWLPHRHFLLLCYYFISFWAFFLLKTFFSWLVKRERRECQARVATPQLLNGNFRLGLSPDREATNCWADYVEYAVTMMTYQESLLKPKYQTDFGQKCRKG